MKKKVFKVIFYSVLIELDFGVVIFTTRLRVLDLGVVIFTRRLRVKVVGLTHVKNKKHKTLFVIIDTLP